MIEKVRDSAVLRGRGFCGSFWRAVESRAKWCFACPGLGTIGWDDGRGVLGSIVQVLIQTLPRLSKHQKSRLASTYAGDRYNEVDPLKMHELG